MPHRTEPERVVASPKRAGLLAVSIAVTALLTIGAAEAAACSCALSRTETSCRDLAAADAIFAGEVVSIDPVMRDIKGRPVAAAQRVTLRVLEAFDGAVGTEVHVLTSPDGPSCGYPFDKGSRYLVYAYARPDGQLTTSRCSRTKHLANIGGELRFLRAPASRVTTRVTGQVRLREDNYGSGSLSPRALAGARFVLSGERQYEAVSDRDGKFAIDVLPGKYAVDLIVADDFYVGARPRLPRQLDLSDPRACPHVEAVAHHDGHVSGRLSTSDGRPAAGVALELVRANDRRGVAFGGSTNERGEFDIGQVAPGKYALRLASDPRVWMPAPASPDEPTPLILGPAERRAVGDFVLPDGTRIVQLSGRVVDAYDRPIAGADVIVRSGADRSHGAFPRVVTDEAGSFSVGVVADVASYRITVVGDRIDYFGGLGVAAMHSVTEVLASEISTRLILRPRPPR